jgi:HAD superfamily hydrolase (TIGR01509 family)
MRRHEAVEQPIKTLLFDFGGTLDADGVAWKERFGTLYQAEGLDMTADTFAPIFYAADDPLIGGLPPATGLEGTVNALAENLESELARRGFGIGEAGKAMTDGLRGERVASRFLCEAAAVFARNRPVLQALSERYQLGIVSNFYGNLEAVCNGIGLASLFAVLVDSHRVGAQKPDPAIFRAALEALRALPETTLFVGDSLRRDREGARRMNMRFVWIAPKDVQAARTRASAVPDYAAVSELRDLATILL